MSNFFTCNFSDVYNEEYAKGAIISQRAPGFEQDFLVLHCLLKHFCPKTVFEVGTELGQGTKIIKNAIGDGTVFTLDFPPDVGKHFGANYAYGLIGTHCDLPFTQVYGDSRTFDFSSYGVIDCFFIDGGHFYENVFRETQEAVKCGAKLLLYHDTDIVQVYDALKDALQDENYNVFRVSDTRMTFAIKSGLSYSKTIPDEKALVVQGRNEIPKVNYDMNKEIVTIIIVYQDSLPWLHVVMNCLKHYKDDVPKRYLFVENVPQRDNASEYVDQFLQEIGFPYDSRRVTPPLECHTYDGRGHATGLEYGYQLVNSEYTMFLDADCFPICDNWLEYLLSLNTDMIGPRPDSGINNPNLKLCHPCFFLFKTKLAKPPFWTKEMGRRGRDNYFGDWGPVELDEVVPQAVHGHRENHFDTCRPFSYTICLNPDLNSVMMRNDYMGTPKTNTHYFLISHNRKNLAIHLRSMSRQWARDGGEYRYEVVNELKCLEFCRNQYPLTFKHSYPNLDNRMKDKSFSYTEKV